MANLKDRTILTSLNVGLWRPWRSSKAVKEAAAKIHKVSSTVATGGVRLLESKKWDELNNFIQKTRIEYRNKTLPWLDSGMRIVPTMRVDDPSKQAAQDLISFLQDAKIEFEKLTKDFLKEYPDHVATAEKRLNGLYVPSFFPSVDLLKERFYFVFSTSTLPDVSDFRVTGIDDETAESIRQNMKETNERAMKQIEEDLFSRIADVVSTALETFENGSKFRVNTLHNVGNLISTVRGLNLTSNEKLERLCKGLEKVSGANAERLREDPDAMAEVKDICRETIQETEHELQGMF